MAALTLTEAEKREIGQVPYIPHIGVRLRRLHLARLRLCSISSLGFMAMKPVMT